MSGLWNVLYMKSPVYEMLGLWSVCLWIVHLWNVRLWNVLYMESPVYEMFGLWNVCRWIVHLWNVRLWNVPTPIFVLKSWYFMNNFNEDKLFYTLLISFCYYIENKCEEHSWELLEGRRAKLILLIQYDIFIFRLCMHDIWSLIRPNSSTLSYL